MEIAKRIFLCSVLICVTSCARAEKSVELNRHWLFGYFTDFTTTVPLEFEGNTQKAFEVFLKRHQFGSPQPAGSVGKCYLSWRKRNFVGYPAFANYFFAHRNTWSICGRSVQSVFWCIDEVGNVWDILVKENLCSSDLPWFLESIGTAEAYAGSYHILGGMNHAFVGGELSQGTRVEIEGKLKVE